MATIATIVDLVTEVIQPAIKEPFELVDVEYGKMGGDYVLSIFVDKPEGITLNDTADLTEIISLERPLKTKEALEGAVGKYVNISLYKAVEKQKVFEGNLVGFEEDVLTIEYMDKTRKKTVEIPYNLVSKARLAVKL